MYLNTNVIDNYAISFYGVNALKILKDIQPYCVYKTPQINAAIEYIQTLNLPLTNEIINTRQKCIKIISDEKLVDIDENDIIFPDQESHKQYIKACFDNFTKLSYSDLLVHCKRSEISDMQVNKKFENKIFNTDWNSITDWSKFNIKPHLEFCETNNQFQLYNYYRKKVSSLPLTGVIGRAIRILVKDEISGKYIGIMCLSSDVYNLGERDNYILKTSGLDWNNKDVRNQKLTAILNLSCCVGLQPFAYNTNGGKLLASLAFSREVYDYYYKKYKQPLLAILTTSINGKSIQYDRLPFLKFIGFTKGYGSVNIPNELYDACKRYNDRWCIVESSNRIDRFTFIKNLLIHLNLPGDIVQHNQKRGIYFGYLFSTKFSEQIDIEELFTVEEIYKTWLNRWCIRRLQNLAENSRFKTTLDLYTNELFHEKFKDVIYRLPGTVEDTIEDTIEDTVEDTVEHTIVRDNLSKKENSASKINLFSDEQLKILMTMKLQNKTTEEVSQFIKNNWKIYINRNIISKLWNSQIKLKPHLYETEEYHKMISCKKLRTYNNRKFTEEEIRFLKTTRLTNSLPQTAHLFFQKYNKTVTRNYISILCNTKIN